MELRPSSSFLPLLPTEMCVSFTVNQAGFQNEVSKGCFGKGKRGARSGFPGDLDARAEQHSDSHGERGLGKSSSVPETSLFKSR